MASLGGFAGLLANNSITQIAVYQVVGNLVGAGLGPYLQALTNAVHSATPLVPLTPSEAAAAVIRNRLSPAEAAAEARMSGVDGRRFEVLTGLAGQAPGAGDMAVALRRGLVDQARYLDGIRQGNLRDEWAELITRLAVQDPSPLAPLQAYLEGQLTEGEARELYARFGGNPEYFEWQYNAQGTAPTPLQAAEMARRGLIPWDGEGAGVTSYRQAFLEGPWRNKWEQAFRALSEYLPPPRTITAMYREGSLSRDRSAQLLAWQGLSEDLIAAYLSSGVAQQTEPSRELAKTTVVELYRDRIIGRPQAADMLAGLNYDPTAADFILQVEDVRLAQRYIGLAIGRVRSRYTAWKIDQAAARAVLADLGLEPDNVRDLIELWDYERTVNAAQLTAAQIAKAFRDDIIDQPEAMRRLEQLGYPPREAWLYLSQSAGEALPNAPAANAVPSTFSP